MGVERLLKVLSPQFDFTLVMPESPALEGMRQRLEKSVQICTLPVSGSLSALPLAVRLKRLAAKHDVVHLNSNHPTSRIGIMLGLTLPRSAPVLTVEHSATDMAGLSLPPGSSPFLPLLFRLSRSRVEKIVGVSRENCRFLSSYYRIPSDKIELVHNGIPLAEFIRNGPNGRDLRGELGLSAQHRIVLVVASPSRKKGHCYLIEAAPHVLARFPSVRFVFAGVPRCKEAIGLQIERAGLEDRFFLLGFRSDVPSLLHGCDVFALPSLSEGFPLALLEALAAGMPVLTTRVGGAEEIIRHGENGWLVPRADPEALAQELCRILALSQRELDTVSRAGIETAKRYPIEATAEKMASIYRELAGKAIVHDRTTISMS